MDDTPDTDNETPRISRRMLIRAMAAAAVGCGAGAGCYAAWLEPKWAELNTIDVVIDGLPAPFEGFTIAHLTDVHRHEPIGLPYIRRCLNLAAGANPDVVAFTGDFVSQTADYMPGLAAEIRTLAERFATYAVLGNHDYWAGADRVRDSLEEVGVRVLVNEAIAVERDSASLSLVGLDDLWEGKPDLDRALARVPSESIKVVLEHNPDLIDDFAERGIELALCGHTHGGQVALPFVGPLIVPSKFGTKYAKGLFRMGKTQMYVNKGIGAIRPAVRFLTRPEVAVVRLMASG